jgi:uncharacterized membrane protein
MPVSDQLTEEPQLFSTAEPLRRDEPSNLAERPDRRLMRWGGIAGLLGGITMFAAVAVVVGFGLPDASDPETLTDFADLETGRILEHFFYLGALMLLALHALVLYRLLRVADMPAALFGAAVATFGFVILAASAVLHVSTTAMADLYTASDATAADQRSIEHAWHGAQSVFDTMLATGLLLVPIGIVLFGVAMRSTSAFGPRLMWAAFVLGVVGTIGAAVEVIDTSIETSGASVLAMVVFFMATSWRVLQMGKRGSVDGTVDQPSR